MATEISGKLTGKRLEAYNELLQNPSNLQEFIKCSQDIHYFLNNYYMIVSVDKGLINYPARKWQNEVCDLIENNRFTLALCSRRLGKTTLVAGIMLWYLLFNNNKDMAVIANKFNRAKEIIAQIDVAYTYLPPFLKVPYSTRNKSEIVLINESRIKAYPTSGDALRGSGFAIIYIDEMAFIPQHVQREFMASTYPTVTSGTTTKIIITSTPNGVGDEFHRIYREAQVQANQFKTAVYDYRAIPENDNEEFRKNTINNIGSEERFKVEYECQFLASSHSLFDYRTLNVIEHHIRKDNIKFEASKIGLKIYSEEFKILIDNRNIYEGSNDISIKNESVTDAYHNMVKAKQNRIVTIDTAEGLGGDYSVANFLYFDVENNKIVQEAILRNNSFSIDKFAGYVYGLCKLLGNPFVVFENNNKSGGEFKQIFTSQYGYTNCYMDKKKKEFGILTRNNNKKLGIKTLTELIENDILVINDYDTFIEMNYFEEDPPNSGKFQAASGYTDDCVMTLVLFCSIYGREKDLFALLYGKRFTIDYMLNPVFISEVEADKTKDDIESFLEGRIVNKKKESFEDYNLINEILREKNVDLMEMQEAGVNLSMFHGGDNDSSKNDRIKSLWW